MGDRPLSMTYNAVHQRIARKRGLARVHRCVAPDCDQQAQTWAWQRTGPYIEAEPTDHVQARRWGTRIEDYEPMCAVHATRLDRGGTLTHCPSGHLRTAGNTYTYPGSGANECLDCKRDGRAERNALKLTKNCETCGVEVLEQNLAAHVATVHDRTAPMVECTACGHRLLPRNLRRHMNRHAGEKR